MNNFYIITNEQKDKNFVVTNLIWEYLKSKGKKCDIQKINKIISIPKDIQCVLVVGGDGTLISASHCIDNKKIPIIGINLGTLGFLTEINKNNIYASLDKIMNNDFFIEKRMMLKGIVRNENNIKIQETTLNDIVISRNNLSGIVYYDIFVNDDFLYTCPSDGIIVSTPTGSTGYNLSAGGPIVNPKAEMILLTPICPHSLNLKSIVLSSEDKITIKISSKKQYQNNVSVIFDGSKYRQIDNGDCIEIIKSEKYTELIKLENNSFVEVVNKKMVLN